MFNDIGEVHEYLNEHKDSVFDLDAIHALLDILHHPEKDYKIIHITGTNGKGSTGAFVGNILTASGYAVGSFSSPAVSEYNEIIKIGNDPISNDDIVTLMNDIVKAIDIMVASGVRRPTAFEMETAMAYLYFARCHVDIAIIEVGMGGENDSTNVVDDTLIELITRISYDHMGILGSTLSEIATNKSGIVKRGSVLITTGQDSEVIKVFENKCHTVGASMVIAGDGVRLGIDDMCQTIGYKGREYKTSLLGAYQMYNLPIALECAHVLKDKGFDKITHNTIEEGVARAKLVGRFEVIGTRPTFIIDGAHNDEASAMLAESIRTYAEDKKLIYILGIFKDKDYTKIIDNTIALASEVITFDWDNPRAMSGETLRYIVATRMSHVKYAGDIESAVKMALEDAESRDAIVAFGSLSHLSKIKKAYKGVKNNG